MERRENEPRTAVWWGGHLVIGWGKRIMSLYLGPRYYCVTRKQWPLNPRVLDSRTASFMCAIFPPTSRDSETSNLHKDQIVFSEPSSHASCIYVLDEKCSMESKWSKSQVLLSQRNRSLHESAQLLPNFLSSFQCKQRSTK